MQLLRILHSKKKRGPARRLRLERCITYQSYIASFTKCIAFAYTVNAQGLVKTEEMISVCVMGSNGRRDSLTTSGEPY